MTSSDDSFGAVLFALFFAWLIFDPTSTLRVQEFSCEGLIESGKCKGKIVKGLSKKFIVNKWTQSVVRTTFGKGNTGTSQTVMLDACRVVDSDNWECPLGSDTKLGFLDGTYFYRTTINYSVVSDDAGLSGLGYWLNWIGVHRTPEWRE